MLANEGMRLKKGEKILLGERMREWGRGKVFTISEVHQWGVRCWMDDPEGDTWWNAIWDEIAGRTNEQTSMLARGAGTPYPD